MRYKKKSPLCMLLAVVLTLSLAACGAGKQTPAPSGESGANDTALSSESGAARVYENNGLKLTIPPEYDELVTVEIDPPGALFGVTEKASVEAAKAQGEDYEGVGWLFDIAKADADQLHEMLCYDMSGVDVFAKGADGMYYLYCHPTDVRLVRENYDDPDGIEQWTALNEWASTVPDTFITENPGLTPETYGNTALDIYLARIAYMGDVKYTLNDVDGTGFDASEYAEELTNGVTFEYAENDDAPDTGDIVLSFPDDDTRFEFFYAEGATFYVRQVWSDGFTQLYRARFADGELASETVKIMQDWYAALAGEPLDASGFTGAEFVGEWQDSVSQRAVMSIKATDEQGVYDVLIHWGGSYNSAMQWRMKAVAGAQDEILSYENGQKVEVTFPDDGGDAQETVIWDNGTGYLMFRDGFLTWYDEQEDSAGECRFVKTE
ncbi:MAG: hypothetical protein IJR72_01625 [Oscillospiraceae bacterium]|nr:hypothetical protein [Oscillospiraceae bacterium]